MTRLNSRPPRTMIQSIQRMPASMHEGYSARGATGPGARVRKTLVWFFSVNLAEREVCRRERRRKIWFGW